MTMLPLLLLGLLSTIGVHGQLEACGDDAVSMGYKSVAALNEAAAASTGIFTICPNSVLSDEILRPMIDGSVFICSSCTLTTGVAIDADNVRLSIVGVTFRDFTDVAISGSAGSSTTLELRQVVFQVSYDPNSTATSKLRHRDDRTLTLQLWSPKQILCGNRFDWKYLEQK